MPDDLHRRFRRSVARRGRPPARASDVDLACRRRRRATVVTLNVGVPAVEIPDGLARLHHDSEAIRRLLEANSQRLGLRRCEIGEAFRKAGRQALNIDQKVQYLIGRKRARR